MVTRLREEFSLDPRAPGALACFVLNKFPSSPFQVALPARVFSRNPVYLLRIELEVMVTAAAILPDGARVSITRV